MNLCPFCKRGMSLKELVRVDPLDTNPEVWRCKHCKILVRMITTHATKPRLMAEKALSSPLVCLSIGGGG